MPVKFIAKRGHDMMTAVRIAEEFGLTYTVENCVDAWRITKDLKKHNVRCVLGPVYGEKNSENRYRDPLQALFWKKTASNLPPPPAIRK